MRGFSLIEIMIGILILGVLLPTTFLIFQSVGQAYSVGNIHASLNEQSRQILDRIALDLVNSGLVSFDPLSPLPPEG